MTVESPAPPAPSEQRPRNGRGLALAAVLWAPLAGPVVCMTMSLPRTEVAGP